VATELREAAAQPVERALELFSRCWRHAVNIARRGSIDPTFSRPINRSITPTVALTTWAVAWIAGQLLATALLATSGYSRPSDAPLPLVLASTMAVWLCLLGAMVHTSRRFGCGRFVSDYGLQVRRPDLFGVGIGALCQLVVIPIVYLPLEAIWPDRFAEDQVQQNASDLANRARGASTFLLIVVVVIGAPIVEELVYRGLIQRALSSRLSTPVAVAATAALFTLIHFRPIEYPGLAVFAVVLGVAAAATGRLGLPIAIHIGFNATGLLMVMR
jgi:membrane protease YdiL (CAAX protease family)